MTARRKYTTLLNKEQSRKEIQEGLIKACNVIDLVIEILRGSKDRAVAKECLVHGVDLSFLKKTTSYEQLGKADATAAAEYFHLKSAALGVDYSGYQNVSVAMPAVPVADDLTAPEVCKINSAVYDKKTGTVTASITAKDSGSPIIYYSYSFDGGKTYSYLLPCDTFSLENIHSHQVSFMENFERQDGIAFFLIYYTGREQMYYLPFRHLKIFWDRAQAGGRKSFRFDELDPDYCIGSASREVFVPYLEILQKDLNAREND